MNFWTNTETDLPLSSLSGEELECFLAPLPSYRARQIRRWICRGVLSFAEMTDIPLALREKLAERFTVCGSAVQQRLEDGDGTIKLRIVMRDGEAVEAVLLNDGRRRLTACLSTQAGCPVGCVFCKTGSLGFSRNLEAHEIAEQFFHLLRESGGPASGNSRVIHNIVVMGMGEPLLNLNALGKALDLIAAGTGLSSRRVTVSTSGLVQGIQDMADRGPKAELAFSLITAREELRRRLIRGEVSLEEIKKALVYYQEKNGRRLTLETVLLGEINTGVEDAEALAAFARGLFAVVNVIPWNPVDGLCFDGKALKEPGAKETENFIRMLEARGLTVTRRYRKGRGVSGACGQLGVRAKTEPEPGR